MWEDQLIKVDWWHKKDLLSPPLSSKKRPNKAHSRSLTRPREAFHPPSLCHAWSHTTENIGKDHRKRPRSFIRMTWRGTRDGFRSTSWTMSCNVSVRKILRQFASASIGITLFSSIPYGGSYPGLPRLITNHQFPA